MRNNLENYNIVLFNEYRYFTFNVDCKINNINFDNVLRAIGKYYYQMDDININKICSLIKDDINSAWHLNRLRKKYRINKVSTTQIKTIRRSFIRLKNKKQDYIRIPFNVIPILFYILHMFDTIDINCVSDIRTEII